MKRKYNYNEYKLFKKVGCVVRDKISPDFGAIFSSNFGFLGEVIAFIFKYFIAKPLHFLTFAIVGLVYNKKNDSPYKGSALYTVFSIALAFFVAGLIRNFFN